MAKFIRVIYSRESECFTGRQNVAQKSSRQKGSARYDAVTAVLLLILAKVMKMLECYVRVRDRVRTEQMNHCIRSVHAVGGDRRNYLSAYGGGK